MFNIEKRYRNKITITIIIYSNQKQCCKSTKKKTNRQEEQVLKWSIFATGLLHRHLPYIFNHHRHLSCSCNFTTNNACTCSAFPIALWPWVNINVIETETVQFCSAQHHIKFESNQSTRFLTHDYVERIFHKTMLAEFSPLDITCAKQTNRLWQQSDFHLIFFTTMTFTEGQGHPNWYQNVELSLVWKKSVWKCLNTSQP